MSEVNPYVSPQVLEASDNATQESGARSFWRRAFWPLTLCLFGLAYWLIDPSLLLALLGLWFVAVILSVLLFRIVSGMRPLKVRPPGVVGFFEDMGKLIRFALLIIFIGAVCLFVLVASLGSDMESNATFESIQQEVEAKSSRDQFND